MVTNPEKEKKYFYIHSRNGIQYDTVVYVNDEGYTEEMHMCGTQYDPGFVFVKLEELYELSDPIGQLKIAEYGVSEFKRLETVPDHDHRSMFAFNLAKELLPEKFI